MIKEVFKTSAAYIKAFIKWLMLAAAVGAIGGMIGAFFHLCLDRVSALRTQNSYIIYFLPIGALIITAMYNLFRVKGHINTNRVITSVREDEDIPAVMVPLIFLGTVITQLFGGSAGREGAALQIGGGIGYNLGRLLKLNKNDIHIITMAGMSSVFSALFGTPVAAAVFCLEVISVGTLNFTGFLPCIIASVTAYHISSLLGISAHAFSPVPAQTLSAPLLLKVMALALCCAVLSILFCISLRLTGHCMKKLIHNPYLRGLVGGTAVVLLTVLCGTFDYNGAGMEIIERALSGEARACDFILKIVFTAITIAAGFKGGEIVPSFFVGSTFGCVMAGVLGMEESLAAAIGMIAVFCGVTNCPIASIILSVEMFGSGGIIFFGVACAVSYIMSGNSGLYKSQKIVYSKLTAAQSDINAV